MRATFSIVEPDAAQGADGDTPVRRFYDLDMESEGCIHALRHTHTFTHVIAGESPLCGIAEQEFADGEGHFSVVVHALNGVMLTHMVSVGTYCNNSVIFESAYASMET